MNENQNQIEERDLMLTPGKIMFFSWINNLFLKKQANIDEDNKNVILLSSFPSTWFCIGRNNEEKSPFIGIQQHMIPWFLETSWKLAVIVEDDGYLYLTCGDEEKGDLTLGIKVRKKRLKVLWGDETQRHLDFRVIKIENDEVAISEKVYKRVPIIKESNISNIVKKPENEYQSKTDKYEDEIESRFNEKFHSVKKETK